MSRRRNRGRGKGPNQPEGKKSSASQRSRKPEPQIDPVEFWGDPERLPEPIETIDEVADVKAVVRSLGRVPISGQETAAEHWFALVYERAAVLAGALAAAGGLTGDETDPTEG